MRRHIPGRTRRLLSLAVLIAAWIPAPGVAESITVASTTSTENSGLFEYLLPEFIRRKGIVGRQVTGTRGHGPFVTGFANQRSLQLLQFAIISPLQLDHLA